MTRCQLVATKLRIIDDLETALSGPFAMADGSAGGAFGQPAHRRGPA
jgi:hypothetical protein